MERRGLWQTAWGIVAAIAVAFDAGLVVARITSDAPLWAIGIATLVMFVSLYFVFTPLIHRWPFAGLYDPILPNPPTTQRVGIRNHPGAKSTSRRSHFGPGVDAGIENMPGNRDQPGGESEDKDSTFN